MRNDSKKIGNFPSMDRRTFLLAAGGTGLAAVLGAGALTSCSSSSGGAAWDGQLRMLGWDFQPEKIQELIGAWSQDSGTDVEVSIIPNLGYSAALQTRLRGGDTTDVYYNFAYNSQKFIDQGWASTLNDLPGADDLVADLFPSARDTYVNANGDIISVPYFSAVHMLHYNEKLVSQAGFASPPQSLEDFYTQSKALKDQGIVSSPYVAYWVKEFCEEYLHTYLLNEGITAFDEAGNPVFADDPKTEGVFEWWQTMYTEGLAPSSVLNDDPGILSNHMAQGDAAFFVLHHYFLTSIRDIGGPESDNVQMAPIGGSNHTFQMGEVLQLGDVQSDEAKAAAWELMKYYGWKTADGKFTVSNAWATAAGLAAPYPGFFTDEDVIAAYPDYYDLPMLSETFDTGSKVVAARTLPWYPDFQAKVGDVIHALLLGQITPAQTVEQLTDAATSAQQGGGL